VRAVKTSLRLGDAAAMHGWHAPGARPPALTAGRSSTRSLMHRGASSFCRQATPAACCATGRPASATSSSFRDLGVMAAATTRSAAAGRSSRRGKLIGASVRSVLVGVTCHDDVLGLQSSRPDQAAAGRQGQAGRRTSTGSAYALRAAPICQIARLQCALRAGVVASLGTQLPHHHRMDRSGGVMHALRQRPAAVLLRAAAMSPLGCAFAGSPPRQPGWWGQRPAAPRCPQARLHPPYSLH
jgi:hypothetical protein